MEEILDVFPKDKDQHPVAVLVAVCHSRVMGRDIYTPIQATADGRHISTQNMTTSPTIQNWHCPMANTWTQLGGINTGVVEWALQARDGVAIYYNFNSTAPSAYMTLSANTQEKQSFDVGSTGLYVMTGTTHTVVELKTWR